MYAKFKNELVNIFSITKESNGSIGIPGCIKETSGFKIYLEKDCKTLMFDYSKYTEISKPYDGERTYFIDPALKPKEPTPEEIVEKERLAKIDELEQEINHLKNQLTASDYKIIKCYEYSLIGLTCADYDEYQLHEERQTMRNQIGELEEELESIK